MYTLSIQEDITTLGFQVTTFPDQIGEAFDSLMTRIPEGHLRTCYGISYCYGDAIVYFAMAEEKQTGEAGQYPHLQKWIIRKGTYNAITVTNWRQKTGSIKEVFEQLMKAMPARERMYCIEWYKTDEEMVCMIQQ